jgi:hypothetical protein
MTDPAIQALEQKLDDISAQLKGCTDPYLRRPLLTQMRVLMAELDRHVLDSTRLQAAKPEPPDNRIHAVSERYTTSPGPPSRRRHASRTQGELRPD